MQAYTHSTLGTPFIQTGSKILKNTLKGWCVKRNTSFPSAAAVCWSANVFRRS